MLIQLQECFRNTCTICQTFYKYWFLCVCKQSLLHRLPSQWEKQLAPLNGAFGPIHIAVLHKRLDVCKLLLELGSSPNEHAWGVDTGIRSKNSPLAQRQNFLKSLRKGRKEGRPDEDTIMARKQAQLLVQAKAIEFVQTQKQVNQLFIKKQQEIGRQYAAGRNQGGLLGGAQKLMAGASTAMLGLANKYRSGYGWLDTVVTGATNQHSWRHTERTYDPAGKLSARQQEAPRKEKMVTLLQERQWGQVTLLTRLQEPQFHCYAVKWMFS
eukprot:1136292-Pelagomonas_calceolata.AAC.1